MKKKILFLLPSFRKGGEAKNTLNILNSLETDHYDLYLLICLNDNNDLKRLLEKKVQIFEFDSKGKAQTFYHIIKTLRFTRPDITFTSFIDLNFIVGVYKLFSFEKLLSILRFNTLPSNRIPSELGFPETERSRKFSVKSANRIVAQSREMRDGILKYYPQSKGKVDVIHNIINRKQISLLSQEYVPYDKYDGITVVAVGSLWVAKGFEFLIRAIGKLVHERSQRVRLFIVGENMISDSDYDVYLESLVKDLKLEKYVFLEGYTSNPYPYMKYADVFALSSLKEGFPNVVLEALSLRVPCVVTDCVDFSSIIEPGSNGYVVGKAEVDSLVDGILRARNIIFQQKETESFDYNEWFSGLR